MSTVKDASEKPGRGVVHTSPIDGGPDKWSRRMVGRISKSALKLPDELEHDNIPDRRSDELRKFGNPDEAAIDAVRDVFTGTDLVDDQVKLKLLLETRGEVHRNWRDIKDRFLAIGRALVRMEEGFTMFENARLKDGMERLFPFGDGVASQLRKVARAVDSNSIPIADCPGSYSTAYQIAMLKPVELELAKKRGLVRPNVTRREIKAFRAELRNGPLRVSWHPTETERDRLVARETALSEELVLVRERIKELDDAELDRRR